MYNGIKHISNTCCCSRYCPIFPVLYVLKNINSNNNTHLKSAVEKCRPLQPVGVRSEGFVDDVKARVVHNVLPVTISVSTAIGQGQITLD